MGQRQASSGSLSSASMMDDLRRSRTLPGQPAKTAEKMSLPAIIKELVVLGVSILIGMSFYRIAKAYFIQQPMADMTYGLLLFASCFVILVASIVLRNLRLLRFF